MSEPARHGQRSLSRREHDAARRALTLVATAPATQGHLSWTWPSWGDIGQALAVHGSDTYYAFVVGAYTAAGHSKMIIAATADSCSTCVT